MKTQSRTVSNPRHPNYLLNYLSTFEGTQSLFWVSTAQRERFWLIYHLGYCGSFTHPRSCVRLYVYIYVHVCIYSYVRARTSITAKVDRENRRQNTENATTMTVAWIGCTEVYDNRIEMERTRRLSPDPHRSLSFSAPCISSAIPLEHVGLKRLSSRERKREKFRYSLMLVCIQCTATL